MKMNAEDLLRKLFDYQKFEEDTTLNQTIKDSSIFDESFVSERDLVAVSGGKYNSDGTYSFKKGEKYYKDHMQHWIYEVLDDYANVSGETMINVDQYSAINDVKQGYTIVSAYDLQNCANNNGRVR